MTRSETNALGKSPLKGPLRKKRHKKMRSANLAHRIFHPFLETQSSSVTRCVT